MQDLKEKTDWLDLPIPCNGKMNDAREWSEESGKPAEAIRWCIDNGWEPHQAIYKPIKRKAKTYEYKGEQLTVRQIGERFNISTQVFYGRLNMGWTIAKAIETPVCKRGNQKTTYTANGKTLTTKEWSKELGRSASSINQLLRQGLTMEEIVNRPLETERLTYTANGKTLTVPEWSKELGKPVTSLYTYFKQGKTIEEIVAAPRRNRKLTEAKALIQTLVDIIATANSIANELKEFIER